MNTITRSVRLLFAGALSTLALVGATSTSGAAPAIPDDRFGVVMAGQTDDGVSADSVASVILQRLNLRWWYSFSSTNPDVPGTSQVQLVRPSSDPESVAARVEMHPGATWILGNEPNVPGQDNLGPDAFATWYHDVSDAIRQTDAAAQIIGPNILNWDATCTTCGGYMSGHAWSDGFLSAYAATYGAPPPMDAWGMHVYDVDWLHPPLTDASIGIAQVQAARGWLDGQPGIVGKPIWITEFGVLFRYASYGSEVGPDGRVTILPTGPQRQDRVDAYMQTMLGWLTTSGGDLKVQKWFLFSALPALETYMTQPAGLALLSGPATSLSVTEEGGLYRPSS